MKKKLVIMTAIAAVMCVCVLVIGLVGCSNPDKDVAYVTMEVNPSIELVVDGNGMVLSINGLNDDGKTLINGENYVGKSIEEVTKKISELLVELKYVSAEKAQEMKLHITTQSAKLNEKINAAFETGMAELTAHYNMALNVAAATTHAVLVQSVMHCHPEMDEKTLTAMTDTELINIIKGDMLEKAELPLIAMEEQFYKLKEAHFKFKYYDEMAKVIDGINSIKVAMFKVTLKAMQSAMDMLNQLETKLLEAQVNSVVVIINGVNIFDTAVELAAKAVDGCITSLKDCIDKFSEFEAEFGSEIDSKAVLDKAEKAINDAKDGFFAKYETEFAEMIAKAKAKIADYKLSLKKAA
ncbi:MAG: hypothetical protein RR054_03495 [Clostridia bacterium]